MSSANENESSAAAPTLLAIVPAIRHEWGRSTRKSLPYMLNDEA
jgi:hypothetical protein